MSDRPTSTFWLPLILGTGFLLLGVPVANLSPEARTWAVPSAAALGIALLAIGGVLAYRAKSKSQSPRGGSGGDATVRGTASKAFGGPGGNAKAGQGGRGGDAKVRGNNSSATGGRGGHA